MDITSMTGRLATPARRLPAEKVIFYGAIVVAGLLVVLPLGVMLLGAFTTDRPGSGFASLGLSKIIEAYSSTQFWSAGVTTVVYALGVTVVAVTVGTLLAWLVERTNVPFGPALFVLAVIRLIVPGLLLTIAWIFLLGPEAGMLNQFFSLSGLDMSLNVFSLWGMIFVEGMQNVPLAFLLMIPAFRSADPNLEDAARMAGAKTFSTLRRVTLPLARPSLLAAILVTFVLAFEGFETPTLVGLRADPAVRTFSTEIFTTARRIPTDFNIASAYATVFLLVAAIGTAIHRRATARAERFATVGAKGFRSARIQLGAWRWPAFGLAIMFVLCSIGLPLLVLLWRSFLPYTTIPSAEAFSLFTLENYEFILAYAPARTAFVNSVIVAAAAGALVMLLTTVLSWFVLRRPGPAARVLDVFLFIPIAMPGLVLGLAWVWLSLSYVTFVYATLAILVIAHVTRYVPYGMQFSKSALIQIRDEMESAAQVSGAKWWRVMRKITLPLMLPGILSGFVFIFVASMRELSASVLLTNAGTNTMPTILFDLWDNGSAGPVAALAMILIVLLAIIVLLVRIVGSRFGVRI